MIKYNEIEKRVRLSLLLEKIEKYEEYCKRLGISDESEFQGEKVKKKECL